MTASVVTAQTPKVQRLFEQLKSPFKLKSYLAMKLPLAAFAGLKVTRLDGEVCEALVPFGWRTQNPFRSVYFAALAMAAELSCASLAVSIAHGAPESVAVLPIEMRGSFEKKATQDTTFRCADGGALFEAANRALETGEAVTVETETIGTMPDGTVAARFVFTWSFKRRKA